VTTRNIARELSRLQLFLLTAAWIATVANLAPLRQFAHAPSAGQGVGLAAFVFGGWLFIFTLTTGLLLLAGLLFPGRGAKVLAAVLLVASAVLGYFSLFLGTQFEKSMLGNILQTDTAEAFDLVNPRVLVWIAFAGVLPAFAALRTRLLPAPFPARARRSLTVFVGLVALTLAVVYAQYPRYASAGRNHAITINTVAPTNILVAAIHLGVTEYAANVKRAPRGVDAHPAYTIVRPRLLFFIVGETARAQNHGLNGYLRDTTPRMRAAKAYYFPDTESCGTTTAISVPCMFSGLSRQEFSLLRARGAETLIDVVVRAGARVIWLDNDSGCKDVCARADYRDRTGAADPRWCPEPGECHDEILLDGLEAIARSELRDTLVVLHLKGSHGPAYFKRYPPAFEHFKPACASSDLSSCEPEALRNAYDNSILYTDHVVGETVRLAEKLSDRFASAVLYVSDHGESLGENGLYLHGMPFAIAPEEQKRVPLFAWVSKSFLALEHWDTACMARQTLVPRTHDNVYPTVLGFMEIESVEYKPALDLFEPCDPPGGGPAPPAGAPSRRAPGSFPTPGG
jgi:lipid A ethanolaminephosphotransferase